MAKFRIDSMASLARQMTFTPQGTRAAQVAAAEALLHSIDASRAYPADYIVFRITGYHPRRSAVSGELLTGLALQHDLGLLVEKVSDTLELIAAELSEPVLTIEDVTEKFNVTSKTIQRWRRRGLPSRRFTFSDGRRRVGFLLSSVERFFAGHQDQVARGTNFSQLTDVEREEILRRARRLATMCGCCEREISRRIARRMKRSPLTVLHIIRKHDQDHPDEVIFQSATGTVAGVADAEIGETDRGRIVRAYQRGAGLRQIARRVCRPRAAVYRVIVDERVARLSKRKVKFIDDPLYHGEAGSAEQTIDQIMSGAVGAIAVSPVTRGPMGARGVESDPVHARVSTVARDLPPYLAEACRVPLLTPPQERALFLKFNFHKYQFVQARRHLEPQFARARDLDVLEGHLRRAVETKNAIVSANLRLVVSIARKHLRNGLSLMELVSDGNITLMRAVEGFDVHKGFRFSTYATLALMKGFARSVPAMLADRAGARPFARSSGGGVRRESLIGDMPDARASSPADRAGQRDELRNLFDRLDPRERSVLQAHFGVSDRMLDGASADAGETASYEQLGRQLGISVQRVRQIERQAIEKLRGARQP